MNNNCYLNHIQLLYNNIILQACNLLFKMKTIYLFKFSIYHNTFNILILF